MDDKMLTQAITRHALIVATCVEHSSSKTDNFLNFVSYFVPKGLKESEASSKNVSLYQGKKNYISYTFGQFSNIAIFSRGSKRYR